MSLIMTNYLISKKLLNELDTSYLTSIRKKLNYTDLFKSDKLFIYSNFLEIINISNDYNIKESLLDDLKWNTFIDNNITYIKTHNYNKENIIFLLSILTSRNIYINTTSYFNYFTTYNKEQLIKDVDYYYSLNQEYDLNKSLYNTFSNAYYLDFIDTDYIKTVINNTIYFPYCDILLNNNIDIFKKITKKTKSLNKHNKKYYYNKKNIINNDFLNETNYNNKSYIDIINNIYNMTYIEAIKILDQIYN